MQAPSLTLGVEEEYQIIDPKTRELTLVHHPDPRGGPPLSGAGEARAAPVHRRGGHQGLPHAGGGADRAGEPAGCGDGAGRAQRPQDRRGRDASVLLLDEAGDHPARALPGCEGGHAGPGPAAPHLRHSRAHRDRGPGVPDRRAQRRRATSCRTSSASRPARRSGTGATPGSSPTAASCSAASPGPACPGSSPTGPSTRATWRR